MNLKRSPMTLRSVFLLCSAVVVGCPAPPPVPNDLSARTPDQLKAMHADDRTEFLAEEARRHWFVLSSHNAAEPSMYVGRFGSPSEFEGWVLLNGARLSFAGYGTAGWSPKQDLVVYPKTGFQGRDSPTATEIHATRASDGMDRVILKSKYPRAIVSHWVRDDHCIYVLLFDDRKPGPAELYLWEPENGSPRLIAQVDASVLGPTAQISGFQYNENDGRLYFSARKEFKAIPNRFEWIRAHGVFVISPPYELVKEFAHGSDVAGFVGKEVLFFRTTARVLENSTQVLRKDPETRHETILLTVAGPAHSGVLSPDGRYFAFVGSYFPMVGKLGSKDYFVFDLRSRKVFTVSMESWGDLLDWRSAEPLPGPPAVPRAGTQRPCGLCPSAPYAC